MKKIIEKGKKLLEKHVDAVVAIVALGVMFCLGYYTGGHRAEAFIFRTLSFGIL